MDVEQEVVNFAEAISKQPGSLDFCFGFDKKLFRYKDKKVKLLMYCLPELIATTGFDEDGAKRFYVFSIKSSYAEEQVIKFPADKLSSKSGFSSLIRKSIFRGWFEGTSQDYQFYLRQEFDQFFNNQRELVPFLLANQTDLNPLS